MNKYNDYENAVYGYLKNYNGFKGQIASIDIEIQGVQEQIKSLGDPKTAKLDDMPRGGDGAASPTERLAERKMKLEAQLPILEANRQRISTLIQRIDHAMSLVSENLQKIVRLKLIEGRRWVSVSLEMKYSERRCQELVAEAVKIITRTMFPNSSSDRQMELDFTFIEYK